MDSLACLMFYPLAYFSSADMAQGTKLKIIQLFLDNYQAAQRQKEVTTELFSSCSLPECKHVFPNKPVKKIVITCSHQSCDELENLQEENWSIGLTVRLFGRPETFVGVIFTPSFKLGPKEKTK